jgi:phage-related minor tail protein
MTNLRGLWVTAALSFGGALLVAGCSTSTTTTTPSATAKPSPSTSAPSSAAIPCAQIDELRTSLTSLTQTKVSASSASDLTKELTDIKTSLADLKSKATGAFSTQATELSDAINGIQMAAAGLSSDPTKAVKELTTDLANLKTKAKSFIAEMNAACPKSS